MKKLFVHGNTERSFSDTVNTIGNVANKVFKAPKKKEGGNNEAHAKKSRSGFYQRIGFKLFITLLIPVALLIAYGIISYSKSQSAIINNYIASTGDTINAISDHIDFALSGIEDKSVEYVLSPDVGKYFTYDNSDVRKRMAAEKVISQKLTVDSTTNEFIKNIYIFGENGYGFNITLEPDFYTTFESSELAKKISASKGDPVWVGEHKILDDELAKGGKEYGVKDYSLSLLKALQNKNGYVVIDISYKQIEDIFKKYDLGKGSITAFITKDGREITTASDSKSVLTDTTYYKKALAGEEENSHSYVDYNGKKYLFLYSRLHGTKASVCALIPQSLIVKQIADIKTLNILFIIIACLITTVTGTFITLGITRAINRLRVSVLQAAGGDLTATFETKRKDEFLILSNGIRDMVANMRKLIGEAVAVGKTVSHSAENLSGTTKEILQATRDISLTMENAQQGIVQQASDTESCLNQMTGLSDQINHINKNTYEIEITADSTKSITGDGIVTITQLADKSKASADITQSVIQKVQEFELQSESIKSFVNIINEIAAQTNLLSLNASIEAARAGEYGRGFAVVAEEIRKLADQSLGAVVQIQKIVKELQEQTRNTVNTAKEAEVIMKSQTEAIDHTIKVFYDINEHVKKLVNNLDSISMGIKSIETAKDDTLMAIESISAVSEESAASMEEMSATTLNQTDSVEKLNQEASELEKEAKRLEEAINVFKIS